MSFNGLFLWSGLPSLAPRRPRFHRSGSQSYSMIQSPSIFWDLGSINVNILFIFTRLNSWALTEGSWGERKLYFTNKPFSPAKKNVLFLVILVFTESALTFSNTVRRVDRTPFQYCRAPWNVPSSGSLLWGSAGGADGSLPCPTVLCTNCPHGLVSRRAAPRLRAVHSVSFPMTCHVRWAYHCNWDISMLNKYLPKKLLIWAKIVTFVPPDFFVNELECFSEEILSVLNGANTVPLS